MPSTDAAVSNKTLTLVIYILYLLGWFSGITALVAIIMNYIKKGDVQGTFLESHFRWQIRTFWFGLLWGIIGLATMAFFIGGFILVANGIWVIYRAIKGLLRLNDNKPMYAS